MKSTSMVDGLPMLKSSIPIYNSCVFGKYSKSPYPQDPVTRATEVLALIHIDLCGSMNTPSLGSAYYFILFIDDFSCYTHVYFLNKKSEILAHFIKYKNLVEKHTNKHILILRSDKGGEISSKKFNQYCNNSGIQRQFTNPYNPTQNGASERKNRTLVESVRSMLKAANLPNSFWTEAISTACYLRNISYTKALKNITPYQLWTRICPNLSHLKVFGCLACTHIPENKHKKLDFKTLKCVFLGYGEPNGIKGYHLYDPQSIRLFFSRDVIFSEDNMSTSSSSTQDSQNMDHFYTVINEFTPTLAPQQTSSQTVPPSLGSSSVNSPDSLNLDSSDGDYLSTT
jgi:hypothetical protein